ncbi:uncharacterized protein CC84DRAFT_1169691 [Paraphaeosphaeria sporulosa]|uniref:NTF2-like protein n=1 Tax=Paraphaeosphaeria sporulosa TaxID=1460663 RepID=A0A177BUZ1_9PLEO|nr:uncharacterized protein CC84DRAFT_1169691 [Paraphaeosphaeria sporulosa]OAF98965.1 hypothetical protein CC84DRAFT_1169691 [Paraphaeosphaeria sporulosa]
MSLSSTYTRFLANPLPSALADNASLHYITTLTTINDAPAIIKHFTVQEKLLKQKEHKLLSAIENDDGALCVDLQVTIEFLQGGGAYLPGLDDNFVSDRTVTFPMVHIVNFEAGKITQIRKYWDQGSLLKQIEVIGARARNWPIRDGKDQIRLIATSAATKPQSDAAEPPRGRGQDEVSVRQRGTRKNTTNAMNDPHASLALFENRQPEEEGEFESHPIASRAQSAKPPPRNMGELFVGDEPGTPTPHNAPSIPKKAGGGKNFKPNRLFDEDDEPAPTPGGIKTSSKKYDHFEFGDGEDTPRGSEPVRNVNKKHQSQWDFEDFVTPEKTKPKILPGNQRSVGWSDDEQEEHSPVHREVVHKPRRDADTHFEFKDDGTPDASQQRPTQVKGRQGNNKGGLYSDHIMGGDEGNDFDTPKAKGDNKGPRDITHIKNDERKKDFGAHWEMKDDSPGGRNVPDSKLTQNQQKVLKTMDANWGNYEPSPQQGKIRIAGNGMGGRSTTKAFSLFEEDPEEAKKENAGIKSMGNGMGGRRGTTALFEEEDPEDHSKHTQMGKKSMSNSTGGRKGATSSFNWDF